MVALHVPVLFESFGPKHPSVFDVLQPKAGDCVLDCTLGLGGHAEKFLELVGANGHVTGLDADADNQKIVSEKFGTRKNFTMIHANFRDIATLNLPMFDVIFADLGLSSPHLDDPTRGFSFRFEGPLDLRLDRSQGETAAELLLRATEKELFEIFADLGEVPSSSKLSKHLIQMREKGEMIKTTTGLKKAVEEVFQWRSSSVLPQIFQALRMSVNNEIGALENLLFALPSFLKTGGRAGIISFHSLEDRLVKQAFRDWTTAEKDETTGQDRTAAPFTLLTKKALVPSPEEIQKNPRSRSAKFRAVQKAV
jgi:16S rRNA (cytosine1402-N4)-methyltransferase